MVNGWRCAVLFTQNEIKSTNNKNLIFRLFLLFDLSTLHVTKAQLSEFPLWLNCFAYKRNSKFTASFFSIFASYQSPVKDQPFYIPFLYFIYSFSFFVVLFFLFFHSFSFFLFIDGEFTPETMTIVCGLVFGLGVIMQNFFNAKKNNVLIKSYLLWSSNLMATILCALGAFCHFQGSFDLNYTEDYKNIPLILLSLFYFTFGIGIYRYTNEYSEQIIPKRCYFTVRCLTIAVSWSMIYLITRILSQLIDNIGVGWLFWFMSTTCVLMSVFIKLFLPSSSKVLEEIGLIDTISENYGEA